MYSTLSAKSDSCLPPARHWLFVGGGVVNKTTKVAIAAAFLFILCNPACYAERWWQGAIETAITVGDGMSLAEARMLGLSSLQWKAAAAAGAQLTTIERLDNERYSAVIELVTASEVQLSDVKETVSSKHGTILLALKCNAKTSLDAIANRTSLVRVNRALENALSDLSVRYASAALYNNKMDALQSPLINNIQSEAYRLLSGDERAAFVRLSAARSDQLNKVLVEAIDQQIMNGTQVSAVIDSITDSSARGKFRIAVRVVAHLPLDDIATIASQYWRISKVEDAYLGGSGLVINLGNQVNNNSLSLPLRDASRQLAANHYGVEVQVGGQRMAMPIAGPEGSWCLMCYRGNVGPATTSSNFTLRSVDVNTDSASQASNLIVLDVPRSQFAGEQTRVTARVVRFPGQARDWQKQYFTAAN